MELFWVAAFMKPTKEESEKGETGKIVLEPKLFLATDEKSATMKAMRHLPEDTVGKEDRVEFRVVTFRKCC